MTVISRLKVDHPTLGTAGGSTLHTSIEAIYRKIGDCMNSRFFWQNLTNGSSADFDHNFNVPFTELRYYLYDYDDTTGVLTRINPIAPNFTVAGTPSFTTTQIRVTNSSGGTRKVGIVLEHDVANPMSNAGELIYGGASGAPTALAAGTAGQALVSGGAGAPSWTNNFTTAKSITGSADAVQLLITGNATQTTNPNLLEIRNSANVLQHSLNVTGTYTATSNILAGGSITSSNGNLTGTSSTTLGPGLNLIYTGSGTQTWNFLTKGTANTTGGATNDLVVFDATGTTTSAVVSSGATNKGIVSFPSNSFLQAHRTTAPANIASGTVTTVSFDTVTLDNKSEFTSNTTFTPKVAGSYNIGGVVSVSPTGGGTLSLALVTLYKDTGGGFTAYRELGFWSGSSTTSVTIGAFMPEYCATAGHAYQIRVQANLSAGANYQINVLDGAARTTYIGATRAG